ncbi:Peptidase M16, C-terminal,Metalloenzyme, LuxS/M16 peptidase-like,Peptidase M16, N-terminal [Cinara cedri]|uniref:Peptidase M16, C-terminal,Metalloenzyme, LuxS/M16 peptidase-like,Peptidase M16, N-terminal n=1 Tax=Cinara cedri TaxID=506608 RepID=A0A5E4NQV4_9HEMI|nr:Peptidase M16, C-terminal,Metalloenzyme, LuxS/M16 peptidase-like,Peptidase M16, N-terminal [Cinara cedri]
MGENGERKMAPVDASYSDRYELISFSKVECSIPVYKYKCLRTGISIVFGDIDGPLVQGHFALATEAHDDDGIPHTLEHLIFLGSENYPYKGILDLLANRCLASGTNAWTDIDHTCYTISTAGSEGFLSLLPVYLDHILYPTLKDAGFITEVHHITSEADDAGVVYCEMQGRENNAESILGKHLLESLYPGKCGYKSETGGIMKNLRESTTNEKIRKYHHAFYRPENLLLLISGKINHADVFNALEPFIKKIISKGSRGDYVRPWQSPVDPLTKSSNYVIYYPSDEEYNGLVNIGFRGPNDIYDHIACQLLLKYLTETPISPLPKEMVEIEDPYCSDASHFITSHNEPSIHISFENVPLDKMGDLISTKFDEILNKLMTDNSYFDLERLRTFIKRFKLNLLGSLDNLPHEVLCSIIIDDFLYGKNLADLELRLNKITILNELQNKEITFWKNILQKYFIDGPKIVVEGMPSVIKQKELAKEENDRKESRIKILGEEGLKQKALELLNAKIECEKKPSKEILTSIKIPNIECIKFYSYKTYSSISAEQHDLFKLTDAPILMEVDDIKTNFVYMHTFINTKYLPTNLRLYLPLMVEIFMESTVVYESGVRIHYTDIIAELEKDIITWYSEVGSLSPTRFLCGTFSSIISLFFQLEPSKYDIGIKWLNNFLYKTEFTREKLTISILKIINEVASYRRDGNHMLKDILRNMIYKNTSNHYACSTLRQYNFLTYLQKQIETDEGFNEILQDLNTVKKMFIEPNNIKMHLAADIDNLCKIKPDAPSLLTKLFPADVKRTKKSFETIFDDAYILPLHHCSIRACAVGMGAIESSYFTQVTESINDFNHPDMPALLVFLQYFTQLEGPMWRNIRGLGYAYSYSISPRPNEALISLHFYRSVNVPAAYKETKEILEKHLKPGTIWDQTLFESAKCSMIFEIVEREKTIGDVIAQSVLLHFRNLSQDYNKKLVKKISEVTLGELPQIGLKYVMPLFDPECTRTAMVCPPSKLQDTADEFKKMNIDMTIYKSLEESFLNECL